MVTIQSSLGLSKRKTSMVSIFLVGLMGASVPSALAGPIATGDIMVSLRNGTVREYTPTGTLVQTLITGRSGELTGSAFDSSGNFYVTAGFTGGGIVKFDPNGNLIGSFGTGFSGEPESMVFDAAGNVYVGQADSTKVVKLSSTGTLLNTYTLAIEDRGTDWVDLAADQKTLHYTSEGSSVKRFDVSTSTQLTDFSNVGGTEYAFRLLAGGGLLVSNTNNVLRINSAGAIAQTYLSGSSLLFALNLDPNGTDFWTAEYSSGRIVAVNIATGAIDHDFNIGAGISGLSLKGEITVSTPPDDTPEPGSMVMLGSGFLAFALWRRRRRA
jgi:hypothetical protein